MWVSVDKAASVAIFREMAAAPVGLLFTLLVTSVAESSEYCFWACNELHQGCMRISRGRGRVFWIGGFGEGCESSGGG